MGRHSIGRGPERRLPPIGHHRLEHRRDLFGLLVGIALSRVELDAHSLVEVALGLVIGLVGLGLFYRQLAAEPAIAIHGLWLALAGVVVIGVMHGVRWPMEDAVRTIVHLIRHSVASCA